MRHRGLAALALAAASAASTLLSPARAEEPATPKQGWSDSAELAVVLTAGNAETSTLGLKNTATGEWGPSKVTIKATAVRADSATITRTAVGTPDDFAVTTTRNRNVTAETYLLDGRYDRQVSKTLLWFAGAAWDRNRFAGIQSRYLVQAGLGNQWRNTDRIQFKTTYAATWTHQEDTIGTSQSFAGLRAGWDYKHAFTSTTTYVNTLVLDEDLKHTADWRGDMVNSVAVTMTKRLALKASLQWLYDNRPSDVLVPLFDVLGTPVGAGVPVALEKLDTVFTTSVVVQF